MTFANSPCVLVSYLSTTHSDYDAQVAADKMPRQDYIELARHIGGTLPLHPLSSAPLFNRLKSFERKLSLDFSLAFEIARRARRHSAFVSMSETIAIPLAAALKLIGAKHPHVVIGHRLSARVQHRVWRATGLQHSFAAVATVSKPQADYAASPAGMGLGQAHFVYDKVDQRFFRPLPQHDEGYILSVGQEQRDYGTLVKAIAGTGHKLIIVASSPWATVPAAPTECQGVTVLNNLSYPKLRELYARARLVVIPVHDVDYAAGVNSVLEAMAMGRPVITTQSRGLAGYLDHGTNAMLVPPGDPVALRDMILDLWAQPRRRAALGEAARLAVEEGLSLDSYIGRLATIVEGGQSGTLAEEQGTV